MIDLHLHTSYSDGTDSVKELLMNAEEAKLEIISITDHDTIDAYKEIKNNKSLLNLYSGKIIPGVELKSIYKGLNIEVLGYGVDYKKLAIVKTDVEKVQKEDLEYLKEVAKKYGLKIDDSIYVDFNQPKIRWASTVFVHELLKYPENIVKLKELNEPNFLEVNFYRAGESNKDSIFYIDTSKYFPDINQVIDDIHNAGGLAFLAHPYIYPFENAEKELEEIISSTEIDGAECEYPLFNQEQRECIKNICQKYNKYISGGSDYHAEIKPKVRIGTGINNNLDIPKELIDSWFDKISGRIL